MTAHKSVKNKTKNVASEFVWAKTGDESAPIDKTRKQHLTATLNVGFKSLQLWQKSNIHHETMVEPVGGLWGAKMSKAYNSYDHIFYLRTFTYLLMLTDITADTQKFTVFSRIIVNENILD